MLDSILKAFADYIRGQNYFDIVHSEKVGYIKILVEDLPESCPEPLDTPEKMLDVLFNEIINDVVFSPENPKQSHDGLSLTAYEEAESRRRITAVLNTMSADDRRFCVDFLEKYMIAYRENGRKNDGG